MAPFTLHMPYALSHRRSSDPESRPAKNTAPSETPVSAPQSRLPAITTSGISTPNQSRAISPISQILSNATSDRHSAPVSPVLSQEAIFRGVLDAAAVQAGSPIKPLQTQREKFKARLRRLLLQKWVLKVLLGKQLANLVYPWVHPTTSFGGLSTM